MSFEIVAREEEKTEILNIPCIKVRNLENVV